MNPTEAIREAEYMSLRDLLDLLTEAWLQEHPKPDYYPDYSGPQYKKVLPDGSLVTRTPYSEAPTYTSSESKSFGRAFLTFFELGTVDGSITLLKGDMEGVKRYLHSTPKGYSEQWDELLDKLVWGDWSGGDLTELTLRLHVLSKIILKPAPVIEHFLKTAQGRKLLPASVVEGGVRAVPHDRAEHSTTPPPVPPKKAQKKRDPITQEVAAQMCAVKLPTIKKWDAGKAPDGYPGRKDLGLLMNFANHYKQMNAAKREARAKNRAVTGYCIENYAREDEDDA